MSRKILSKRYPQITQITQMTPIETAKDLKNLRNLPAPNAGTRVDEFLVRVEKTFLENYTRQGDGSRKKPLGSWW